MKKLTTLLLILGCSMICQDIKADHFFGADITYKILDTATRRYRITVTLYRSCSGIPDFINKSLNIRTNIINTNVPMTLLSKKEVTPQCQPPDVPTKPATNCPGQMPMLANGTKGVEEHIYTVDYTFGSYRDWIILGYQECCRNVEISTGQSWQNAWVQAGINAKYVNNSPIFRSPPIPYWCRMRVNTYNHGAVDTFDPRYVVVNGKTHIRDSLNFVLICPFMNPAGNVNDMANLRNPCCTYNSPLNKFNFLYTVNGVNFDPKTGQYTCIPDRVQDAVMAVAVEEWRAVSDGNGGYYRDKIGYVCRDVQITVRESCPDIFAPGVIPDSLINANRIDFDKVDICGKANSAITFKLVGAPNQNLIVKVLETPKPEAIINFKYKEARIRMAQTDTVYGTVTFDSAVGVGSERLLLEYYYCDVIGNKVSRYYVLTLNFRPAVKVKKQTLYYCPGGKPARAEVSGASKYRWTPKTGIVGAPSDSSWADLAPSVSTIYRATGIDGIDVTLSCTVVDSVRVLVIPRFNYTLAPKLSNVCMHDTIAVSLNTQVSNEPYLYNWTDPVALSSLFDPVNNIKSTKNISPKVVASKSSSYAIEMTDKFGCTITDSIRVNVNGVRPVASGWSARKLLCPGDTTMLSVNVIPKTCGPSIYTCAQSPLTRDVTGSGVASYPSGSNPHYPNPFNTTGVAQGATTRIIYTRAELLAAGVRPGIILSIAFNILSPLNIPTIDRFEVRIGSTMLNDARILNIPMFTILGPKSHTFTTGFDGAKFTINGGFDWDGISNIVIETHCRNNSSSPLPNTLRTINALAGNSVASKLASAVGQDAELSTNPYVGAGATSAKPQLRIEYCTIDSSNTAVLGTVWQPTHLVTALGNPRAIGRVTQIDSVFVATVGTSSCFDTAMVRLNIDQNFKVKINPGKRIYCVSGSANPLVNLSATVTGGVGTSIAWTLSSSTTGNAGMTAGPHLTNTLVVNPGVGQHTYVISAVNGPCNATDTVVITVQPNIPLNLKLDSALCTASNGKMKAILPAGNVADSFNYTWLRNGLPFGAPNRDSIINLLPNRYSLQISLKSDPTCTGFRDTVLSAKMDTITSSILTSGIRCKDSFADSIWVAITSTTGSGSYRFDWSPTAGVHDTLYKKLRVDSGSYFVTITDKITGCQGRKSFLLTEPNSLRLTHSIKPVNCKGENSGEIAMTASGGTLPTNGSYSYIWSSKNSLNGAIPNFNELINLYTDTLCVTVTDANNCSVTECHIVPEPSKSLTIDSMRRVCATTVNGADGKAMAYISGGTASYTYTWTRQNTATHRVFNSNMLSDTATGLNKQVYRLSVRDAKGCTAADSIMLCDIICNWKFKMSIDSVKCYDSATGKIVIGAIDSLNYLSTLNYTYTLHQNSLSNPPLQSITRNTHYPNDSASFIQLKSGYYIVRLQSNLGCDTTITAIDIPQNPAIQGTPSVQMPSCYRASDGKVCVAVVDKFSPFGYDYGTGNFIPDSCDINQTAGTNKVVRVRNSLGCIVNWLYDISTPDTIAVSLPTIQTRCKSSLTPTDEIYTINVVPTNSSHLNNFSYHFKPGIGLKALDTTSNQLDSLPGGSKSVLIKYFNTISNKFCTYNHSFTVSEPDTLIVTIDSSIYPRCHNESNGRIAVKLNAGQRGNIPSPPYTYQYELRKMSAMVKSTAASDPAAITSFTNLDSGIYLVRVIDHKGCTHFILDTLEKPDTFRIGFGTIRDANCISVWNGSIEVAHFYGGNTTSPNSYTFQWEKTSMLNGATSPIGPYGQVASGLEGLAKYKVIVADSKGCEAERETIIDTMYQLRINKVQVDSATCFEKDNGLIKINSFYPSTAPLPYSYRFSSDNVSQDISQNYRTLRAGTYSYTMTDGVGCQATGISSIYEPSKIIILGDKIIHAKCHNEASGSIKIKILGGSPPYSTPEWNQAPYLQYTDSAIQLAAGLHIVRLIDAKGCPASQPFDILQPSPFTAKPAKVKHITCYKADNGEIEIATTGGFPNLSYEWSHGLPNAYKQSNLKPASYRLTITDANGCKAYVNQVIKEPLDLSFDADIEPVSCPKFSNGIITINATGGTPRLGAQYDYSVDGGSQYFSSSKFSGLAGREYNVIVRDSNGCIAAKRYQVEEPAEPVFTVHKDSTAPDTLTMGNQIGIYYTKLMANTGFEYQPNGINWTPSSALSCSDCARPKASPFSTTIYEVELTYHKDCKAKATIKVPVYDPLDFFVPSAFTPGNGDGLNDKLFLYGNGIKKMSLLIFNRWGEKIFESNHTTTGWDGTYKGEPQPTGVYSYTAEVEYLNGEKRNKKGSITLVK